MSFLADKEFVIWGTTRNPVSKWQVSSEVGK